MSYRRLKNNLKRYFEMNNAPQNVLYAWQLLEYNYIHQTNLESMISQEKLIFHAIIKRIEE